MEKQEIKRLIEHYQSKCLELYEKIGTIPKSIMFACSVDECIEDGKYLVMLRDIYPDGEIFYEPDETCSYLCERHMMENQESKQNSGGTRPCFSYKYTNKNLAQGWSEYIKNA